MTMTNRGKSAKGQRFPLLGHLPALWRDPVRFLQGLRREGDIVTIRLGARPVYIVNSPELIQKVLVNEADKFTRGRIFEKARPLLGNGLLTIEDAFHQRERRVMQPAFHRDRIAEYTAKMQAPISALVDAWRPGEVLEFDKEMADLALTVTARTLCGTTLSPDVVAKVRDHLPVFMRGTQVRTILPTELFEKLPIPANRRFDAARFGLLSVVDDMIRARGAEDGDRGDLLSILAGARYETTGERLSAEQIRDEVITVLIGGTETTAASLSWLFYELSRNPEIERRIHAELDEVLAGEPVTVENLPKLTYTNLVLNENFRLHSPIWMLMRRVGAPIELGGVQLEHGADVLISPASMHRDPDLFPRPEVFDPERWRDAKMGSAPSRTAFIPFSAGHHKCIGDNFVRTDMAVAVATICSRWYVRLAPGHHVEEVARITLRPNKMPMIVHPRERNVFADRKRRAQQDEGETSCPFAG
ncbi:cytochrome P450 [Amycolatopsis thailandensis]|uniref:cytochrome P450 n=1 Tax=Amycolatopsis thailandensis TaxID=589330 RepID=UPI00363C4970